MLRISFALTSIRSLLVALRASVLEATNAWRFIQSTWNVKSSEITCSTFRAPEKYSTIAGAEPWPGGLQLSAAVLFNFISQAAPKPYPDGVLVLLVIGIVLALLILHARNGSRALWSVNRRKEFQALLSDISSRFPDLPVDRTGDEIRRGLDHLRGCLDVDKVSFFTRPENQDEFHLLSSSSEDQIGPPISTLEFERFPWTMNQLLHGEAVLVERVDHLPPQAVAERILLQNLSVKSFLAVPVSTDRSVPAVFFLTERARYRKWQHELICQLKILGAIFYQAHSRQIIEGKACDVEQRFSLAVDQAPVMVWMSDTAKLCTYFNHGWLAFRGRAMNDELGQGWTEGIHPADRDQWRKNYSAAFDAREKFKLEYRLRRFDGEYRWIVDYGLPRYRRDGTFCGFIGSCMDVTDARRSEQELKELSSRLIEAQESERQRIARELHDDFSQQLTLLALELTKLSAPSHRDTAIETLVSTLEERIRRLAMAMNSRAHQLHSSHLETLGLASAIQGFCRDFSEQHQIAVDFQQSGVSSYLPPNVSLCLFRIVQEGLQNIAKHSRTRTCWVELAWDNPDILLRIADSGIGFDPTSSQYRSGLGMISMRERLRLVNGDIRVLSSPAKGTRLEARVPIAKASA